MHVMSSFLMHIRERALFSTPFGWKPGLFTLIPWLMPARIVDSQCFMLLEQDSVCSQEIFFLNCNIQTFVHLTLTSFNSKQFVIS